MESNKKGILAKGLDSGERETNIRIEIVEKYAKRNQIVIKLTNCEWNIDA